MSCRVSSQIMCCYPLRRVSGRELDLDGPVYYPIRRPGKDGDEGSFVLCNIGRKESVKLG